MLKIKPTLKIQINSFQTAGLKCQLTNYIHTLCEHNWYASDQIHLRYAYNTLA